MVHACHLILRKFLSGERRLNPIVSNPRQVSNLHSRGEGRNLSTSYPLRRFLRRRSGKPTVSTSGRGHDRCGGATARPHRSCPSLRLIRPVLRGSAAESAGDQPGTAEPWLLPRVPLRLGSVPRLLPRGRHLNLAAERLCSAARRLSSVWTASRLFLGPHLGRRPKANSHPPITVAMVRMPDPAVRTLRAIPASDD